MNLYRKFRLMLCRYLGIHSFTKIREIRKKDDFLYINERKVCDFCGLNIQGNRWKEQRVEGGTITVKEPFI